MKQPSLAELTPGNSLHRTFLVRNKERKLTKNGDGYLDLELQDSTGSISAKLWGCDSFAISFDADDIVEVEGKVREYQGKSQITISGIRKCDPEEVNLLDFLPRTEKDVEQMYAALVERVEALPQGPIRALLLSVLGDSAIAPKFKLAPAAVSFHHARLGGLLEHVSSLVGLGDQICDHYPDLRREMVLAGLILHDVGKLEELSFLRGLRYTTRGQLLGHISIGVEVVLKKAQSIPELSPSLRDQLVHIILAHHGKLEFGSPKEPVFPEALVVHYLDDMDSKLESMRESYDAAKGLDGEWTSRNAALRRELFRVPPPDGNKEPS